MAYSILPAISEVLDFPHYWNADEVAKMQTEPPQVDLNGNIISWSPSDFPSTSGLAYANFEKYKDPDGYLGWFYRLKARYNLGKLYIWDSSGNPTVRIRITDGDYSNWTTVYEATFSKYNVPITIDVSGNIATDIWVEVKSVSYVPKFHIWAEKINGSDISDPEPSYSSPQPKYGFFQRYCTMAVTPVDFVPKGTERVYLDTRWVTEVKTYNTKDNILLRFDNNITAVSNLDTIIQAKKARNGGVPLQVNPKELPYYTEYGYQGGTSYTKTAKWVDTLASDTYDPLSYQMASAFFYSFTARYGSNSSMDNTYLRLMSGESIQKGLGYIDVIEIWNELDMWWGSDASYHDPTQMAAFFSAVIDGHNGAMGDGHGIKTADPNMKISVGGLVGLKKWWIWWVFHEMARLRSQTYNDIVALFEQIDYHHYCNDGDGQLTTRTTGVSPEADNMLSRLQEIRDIRDRYHPNSAINLGEFGWDYYQGTDQKAPPIVDNDIDKTQTAWAMRTMLIGYLAGMDAMTWYMVPNATASERDAYTRYMTCGLATSTYTEKYLAWFGLNMLANHLYDCDTVETVSVGDSVVTCLKFTESADSTYERYVVWCNTSNNTKKQNITIDLGATMTKANEVVVALNADNGRGYLLDINSSQVTIDEVSELPLVILADTSIVSVPSAPHTPIIINKVFNNTKFSWSIDDFDISSVEIHRGTSYGNETRIATLLPSVNTYTDTTQPNVNKIYYKIVSKNSAGQNEVRFIVDLPVNYTVNQTVNIDANNSGTLLTPSDFNRIDSKSLFSNLLDDQGVNSGLSFQFVGTGWGWFNYQGENTGNDSGAVPDNALRTYMAGLGDSNQATARIAGLDVSKTYVIKCIGSRDFLSTSKQLIELNGAGEVLESAGNIDQFITFYSITGATSIDIDFSGYANGGQYLNAMIIEDVNILTSAASPISNAGIDQSISVSTSTLNGTASYDPDGTIVSYLWQQVSGPNTANILTPTGSSTIVNGLIVGDYVFRLTVTDDDSLTDTDTITITVNPVISTAKANARVLL